MDSTIALQYDGFYARFDTVSKKNASMLLSADNLIGDRFSIEFETFQGTTTAWARNRFGARVGFFDEQVSRRLSIHHARGWKITALFSFVAFSDNEEKGGYWGEMAFICYNPAYHADSFERFIDTIGSMMEESLRPDISLSQEGLRHVIENNGSWKPSGRIPLPQKENGMAILKRRRRFSEKIIEKGRERNKGCYVIAWLFIIVVIAALVFGIYSLLKAFSVI